MKVFSAYVDNDLGYEDHQSITVLIAAHDGDEANEWLRSSIEKKEEPFGYKGHCNFFQHDGVIDEPKLETSQEEVGLITHFCS